MKVRFLQDYRGVLTGEVYYTKDSVADLPNGDVLVAAGRAEAVEEPKKEKPEPAAKKRGRPKKKASK